MDQRRFFVIREERRNVVVQHKHIIRHQQADPVKLIMRSDEFPELYHLDMPTHHYHVQVCQRPPVADQVQNRYAVPSQGQNQKVVYYQANQPPPPPPPPVNKPAPGNVINSNEAAKLYNGILIKQYGKPAPGNVIDSNEAAKLYNGILIKESGRNKLPAVRV